MYESQLFLPQITYYYCRIIQHGVYVYSVITVHYKIIQKTFLLIHHKHMSFGVRVKSFSILISRWEPAGMECSFSFWRLPRPLAGSPVPLASGGTAWTLQQEGTIKL